MIVSRHRIRALLATAAVAVLALTVTACSTGPAGGNAAGPATTGEAASTDTFPVTIKHAHGTTTITSPPARVATLSWVNADIALALGVVPVGMSKEDWGANDTGSTPWKDAALQKLGAAIGTDRAPVQYSESDGIPFAEIAKVNPDVILAAYSGITAEDYQTLSKIAPVVAYPKVAYGTAWQESTRMIGAALGKSQAAEALVAQVEKQVTDATAKHPELKGKTFIYGSLDPTGANDINLYTAEDNTARFLSSLGMTLAPIVDKAATGSSSYYVPWSNERANELDSDVFVAWLADPKAKQAVEKRPLLSQIPAVKGGGLLVDANETRGLALLATSPLSVPWLLDEFLPLLVETVKAAEAAK